MIGSTTHEGNLTGYNIQQGKKRKGDVTSNESPCKKVATEQKMKLYENLILNKDIPRDIRQRADEELLKFQEKSPISDLPEEILVMIFSMLPEDLGSLQQVNKQFQAISKDSYLAEEYSKRCLEVLNDRFIETGLAGERFDTHVEIAKQRLQEENKDFTSSRILQQLINFQAERFPDKLFTDESNPRTFEGFLEREMIIKKYNIYLIAKKLFEKQSVFLPFTIPKNKERLTANDIFIKNYLEILRHKTQLDLERLDLTELPEEMFSVCSSVERLTASCNRISFIPKKCFNNLTSLQELFLNSNRITKIDKETFSKLINLQKLALDINRISKIDKGTFSTLSNLQWLGLYFNRITNIDKEIFSELNKLEKLRLHRNRITKIDKDTFSALNNLQKLWLNDNRITKINKGVFRGLNSLQKLKLNMNQFSEEDKERMMEHRFGHSGLQLEV